MKITCFVSSLLLLIGIQLSGYSQDQINRKKILPLYKGRNTPPDSVKVFANIYPKSDTLYVRNLNVEKKDSNEIFRDLIQLLGVLLGGLLGWLTQFFSKKQEKNVYSFNLKEEKRISHLEKIALQINNLSLCDPQNTNEILTKVNALSAYTFSNGLHVNSTYQEIVNNVCDYYSSVAENFKNKNIQTETQFMNQFKAHFNK